MSQSIAIEDVQPLDFVHWGTQRCPGDNYNQVIAIAPNDDLIVIYRGVRKTVKRSDVTAAVRTTPVSESRGPILQGPKA